MGVRGMFFNEGVQNVLSKIVDTFLIISIWKQLTVIKRLCRSFYNHLNYIFKNTLDSQAKSIWI